MKIKGLMTLLLLSLFSAPLYAAVDFFLPEAGGRREDQGHPTDAGGDAVAHD